jgi:hypothetical protein
MIASKGFSCCQHAHVRSPAQTLAPLQHAHCSQGKGVCLQGTSLGAPVPLELSSPANKLSKARHRRWCWGRCSGFGWSSFSTYRTLYICACSTAFANAMTFRCTVLHA